MHVRPVQNWSGGGGVGVGTGFGQPMLFECMGICVVNPAPECGSDSLVYLLSVKYSSYRFCLRSATVY